MTVFVADFNLLLTVIKKISSDDFYSMKRRSSYGKSLHFHKHHWKVPCTQSWLHTWLYKLLIVLIQSRDLFLKINNILSVVSRRVATMLKIDLFYQYIPFIRKIKFPPYKMYSNCLLLCNVYWLVYCLSQLAISACNILKEFRLFCWNKREFNRTDIQ